MDQGSVSQGFSPASHFLTPSLLSHCGDVRQFIVGFCTNSSCFGRQQAIPLLTQTENLFFVNEILSGCHVDIKPILKEHLLTPYSMSFHQEVHQLWPLPFNIYHYPSGFPVFTIPKSARIVIHVRKSSAIVFPSIPIHPSGFT